MADIDAETPTSSAVRLPGLVGVAGRRELSDAAVPYPIRVAGAWAWRIIVIAAAGALIFTAASRASNILIPLAVAVLLTSLLTPLVNALHRGGFPRALASLSGVLALIVAVVGMITIASTQVASGWTDMVSSLSQGLDSIQRWLADGPFNVTGEQLSQLLETARQAVSSNQSAITSGALAVGASAIDFLAGTLIALIATFFFLLEGRKIWAFFVVMLPVAARVPVFEASRRGWRSLAQYARTQVMVAGVDAIGIGIGALALGLPFVVPIILVVFVASFVPIVGAFVSGALAVLIAFVVKGPVTALIMLAIVLGVQQIESHVLQPFLMGHAVALHPLAVIVAVGVGTYLYGIVGALFAVPLLATLNSTLRYLVGHDPFPDLGRDSPQQLLPPEEQAEVADEDPVTAARRAEQGPAATAQGQRGSDDEE